MQFSTQLDVSQLPAPQRAQFEQEVRQIDFHVVGSDIDAVDALDVRSEVGGWQETDQVVDIANNRGLAKLARELGDVADWRVRLCLSGNTTVCGAPALAEHALVTPRVCPAVPAGSMIAASSAGIAMPTTIIIIIVVVVIVLVTVHVLVFICCYRRNKTPKKTTKTLNDDAYNHQKLPAYHPPIGVDTTDLAHMNQYATEVIYVVRPRPARPDRRPAGG